MTRTGNRLTTADVSEWDGDDEMEYSIYNYNHNANGAMTLKTDTDNRYRFNGKERHDWAGYAYIDYGARMYNPVIGSWLSPDPLADKYTSTSPYVFCAGDPVNYVDKKGEFPLAANIAGAVVAMATDYVSQAVANVIVNGFSVDAFTKDIDLIDIGIAGIEGFATMGASAYKTATAKTAARVAISATSAAISNTVNYKVSDQEITYNPVEQVVTGTMVGAVVGAIPGSDKTMEVMKPRTNSKAVETARVTAHAEGKKFSAESAKTVAKENTARNVTVKKVNETVTDLVDSHKITVLTDTANNTFWNYLKEK